MLNKCIKPISSEILKLDAKDKLSYTHIILMLNHQYLVLFMFSDKHIYVRRCTGMLGELWALTQK